MSCSKLKFLSNFKQIKKSQTCTNTSNPERYSHFNKNSNPVKNIEVDGISHRRGFYLESSCQPILEVMWVEIFW